MADARAGTPRYRFGFVLTVAAGNKTRLMNLRKYADRDPEVECVWAPISHYLEPGAFAGLPAPLRSRLIVRRQAQPVMGQLGRLDAVMFHAFEPYVWASVRSLVHRRPCLVWSQDNPPISRPESHPQARYGRGHERPAWRMRMRFALDRWCAGRTALFLPFSRWAGGVLTQDCGVPAEKVHPIHGGLDLETWPYVPRPDRNTRAPRLNILFVGGDFDRKGGPVLLEVFASSFSDRATLTLVTGTAPPTVPPNVVVHSGVQPDDPLLRKLYADCDLFVLPTIADMSSWAALEAMATGRPVIISGVGGIPELVDDGVTGFLIPPDDRTILFDRLRILMEDPSLRHRMGQAGRQRVETHFDARVSVPAILDTMKRTVDQASASQDSNAPNNQTDQVSTTDSTRRGT